MRAPATAYTELPECSVGSELFSLYLLLLMVGDCRKNLYSTRFEERDSRFLQSWRRLTTR